MKTILALWLALCLGSFGTVQAKPRIEKAADLPRFTYAIQGSLEHLVRDSGAFDGFASRLAHDVESVLADYEIADRAAQRDLLGTLLRLDVLQGRDVQALARVDAIRALEDKPADKLLSGILTRAVVEAHRAAGKGDPASYRRDVARRLTAALGSMPYEVIANEIRQAKAGSELIGESLVLGHVRNVLQPIVDRAGSLSSDLAPGIVRARYALLVLLPLKQTLVDTYSAYLAAHKVERPDIWAARSVTLPPGRPYTPVAIGVWDGGVDPAVFGRQVLRDAGGKPLLIAFDKYSDPAGGALLPIPAALRSKLPQMKARMKGFSDLQSNIESAEATEVKRFLSTLRPDEYRPAIEEIALAGNYEHGTHVAGIALAGNPYARLLIARIEFGYTLKPDPCPSREQAEKDARALLQYIEFFKRHQARIVNMSWGGSVTAIESDLEQCGVGKTPEARKALAREYFRISRQAMIDGFAGAPGILWITAAGNSNQDASFAEDAPADIVAPNLLTVGAVDQAGDEASFTSYGPTVKLHADGYQVESYVPGGDRIALSGTSMAAPQVANVAGKMLAVNPALTPPQVIAILLATADKTADGRRTLVNPAKAVEEARSKGMHRAAAGGAREARDRTGPWIRHRADGSLTAPAALEFLVGPARRTRSAWRRNSATGQTLSFRTEGEESRHNDRPRSLSSGAPD